MTARNPRLQKIINATAPIALVHAPSRQDDPNAIFINPTKDNPSRCGWVTFASAEENKEFRSLHGAIQLMLLELMAEDEAGKSIDNAKLASLEEIVSKHEKLLQTATLTQ